MRNVKRWSLFSLLIMMLFVIRGSFFPDVPFYYEIFIAIPAYIFSSILANKIYPYKNNRFTM